MLRVVTDIKITLEWLHKSKSYVTNEKYMNHILFICKTNALYSETFSKQGDRLIPRCEGRAVMESRRNQFPLPSPLLEAIAT
jgi:hypothetical protein